MNGELKIDPEFKALIPPLSAEEREGLEANIRAHGCRVPLDVWDGVLVDGHNRHEICTRLGVPFETKPIQFENRHAAKLWIIRSQFDRRNLTPGQRMRLALALKAEIVAQTQERKRETEGRPKKGDEKPREKFPEDSAEARRTNNQVASLAGVSGRTLDKYEAILEHGAQELIESVDKAAVSVDAAYEIATSLPIEKQTEIATTPDIKAATVAKEIKAEKHRKSKAARLEVIKSMPWPAGQYRVIYADPPWSYDNAGLDASAAKQYETMDTDTIGLLPVCGMATKNAVLFMWATSPLLPDALRVIDAWGFQYKTSIVWDKDAPNYGNYVSVQHEFLLVATRGSCTPDIAERPGSVLRVKRTGRHSEKPAEFRALIDQLYPHGPRIELFARTAADGWERWGNEA